MGKLSRTLAFLVLFASSPALAEPGTWVPQENFAQVNVLCFRFYVCTAPRTVMFDPTKYRLSATPAQSVRGICTHAVGIDGGCDECNTNPPAQPCDVQVVPR
jgi:hypothetical protein